VDCPPPLLKQLHDVHKRECCTKRISSSDGYHDQCFLTDYCLCQRGVARNKNHMPNYVQGRRQASWNFFHKQHNPLRVMFT
jgi:hypothetical protein